MCIFFSEGIFVKLSTRYFLCVVHNLPIYHHTWNPPPPPLFSFSRLLSPSFLLFPLLLPSSRPIFKPHVSFIIFPFSNQDLQESEGFSPLVLLVTKLHEILKWIKPKVPRYLMMDLVMKLVDFMVPGWSKISWHPEVSNFLIRFLENNHVAWSIIFGLNTFWEIVYGNYIFLESFML